MRAILMISASVFMLSACQTLDFKNLKPEAQAIDPVEVTPTAPKWVEAAPEDLPSTDWVADFSDGQLLALVNEALEANTNILAAAARVEAAQARNKIANADRLPTVSGSADISRREDAGPFPSTASLGYGVSASWEADLWGRIRDGVDAAELETGATQADYAGARLSIAGQVTQAWFDLVESRLLTELSVRDVETQERALRLTTRRFEGGVSGSSDVRLARSALANAQALQATRRQIYSSTARRLEILLRRYPSEDIVAAADLPALPPLTGAGVPGDVLRKRPDLLAAEGRLRAQGLQVDIARKNLLPRLTLNGGGNVGGNAFNDLFDIDALVGTLAAGLTQPIFQGGALKANVEQQRANLKVQLENYAGTALNAYFEVENALDGEQRLAEREAALRISLDEAFKAEERLEIRYTEGLATILQLLDAQSRRISAESQLISARKERLANRVRMHIALGGGLYGGGVANSLAMDSVAMTSGN